MTCDRSVVSPVSSTNKTDRHDVTEILLKVALNTINQTKSTDSDLLKAYPFLTGLKIIHIKFKEFSLFSDYCAC